MTLALLTVAVLAALAAALNARAAVGPLLAVAGLLLSLGAFAAGTFLDAPAPVRFACWVYGVAALGKTLALGRLPRGPVGAGRGLLFLLLWPGLDLEASFARDPAADRGAGLRAAGLGLAELVAAVALASLARRAGLLDAPEPFASWARAGSFVLAFDGAFRAAMGAFRAAGLATEACFREPWLLRDLADFWGRRWNRFVGRTLALEVFAPVRRRAGPALAVLATFLMSGVLHEAAIGVAAGAPDGRYVAFFLAHGAAVLMLSRVFARAAGSPSGRLFRRAAAWAVLLATAPLFFGGPYPRALPLEWLFQ